MCNRVRASFEFREIKLRWDLINDLPQYKPIYNISPGRKDADVLAIVRGDRGNEGRLMYWPLIPSYEKSMKLAYSTMNAKVERLRQSNTWHRLLEKRRCVIPIDGFYEFVGEKGSKIPWFIYLKSREPFSLAGFWDTWKRPDGGILESFSIITLPPNDFMRPIHDRIPAILRPEEEETWLDCAGSPFDKVEPLLVPFPSDEMAAHITSTRVNNSRYNEPDCGRPIEELNSASVGGSQDSGKGGA
jgi:putative SOS response-associated peptidase YedK